MSAIQLVGGLALLGAGVFLLVTGHNPEGAALTVAGASELGAKAVLSR
jgi:hypothetical protein